MKCINVAKQRCTGSSPKFKETHQQKSKEKKNKEYEEGETGSRCDYEENLADIE